MEKPLFRFLLSRVNDPAEAADLLQDVFMEV
jgi:DNA-directed RNA polymerase specialized sigma24 family protein